MHIPSVVAGQMSNYRKQELFNLLINPLDHDFSLRWHRDDIHENVSEEEERSALRVLSYGVSQNHSLSTISLPVSTSF